jgi:glycosyltransferase involved in cell wall biosynthesis
MNARVIISSPYWSMSGVNVFCANLSRELRARNIATTLFITEHNTARVTWQEPRVSLPDDIPVELLPVSPQARWSERWRAMVEYLEQRAPCIYLPNHDWRHSCVSPLLSPRVVIVGRVASDDPLHYDHVARLGNDWNAIVAVSTLLADEIKRRNPQVAERVTAIPNGAPLPARLPERALDAHAPLKIIYAGKINQYQKRVFDILKILDALEQRNISFELTVAGDGQDADAFRQACSEWMTRNNYARGKIHWLGFQSHARTLELLAEHDVFLLTSAFEGMPEALLEAMARGCAPIVSDVSSGIPELVRDGENGFRVPIGAIELFATRLAQLQQEPVTRAKFARASYETIVEGGFSAGVMAARYIELFERVDDKARRGTYQRMRRNMLPPPREVRGIPILPMDAAREAAQANKTFAWRRLAGFAQGISNILNGNRISGH